MTEDWTEADQAIDQFRETIQGLITEDLQNANNAAIHQPVIYHYTDVKGALGILQTGRLWFTERAHLNDPVEVRYGVQNAYELFETEANKLGEAIPREAISHLKAEQDFSLAAYGFWIASFSLDNDHLGQWRNYADDGRGVCLGFSSDNFDMVRIASFLPNAPNSLRYPVNYIQSDLGRKLLRYVSLAQVLLAKANLAARGSCHEKYGRALLYERNCFQILNNGILASSLIHKHPVYADEREYRLLISGVRNTISRCAFHSLRERSSEIVGYLDIPIPNWKHQSVLTHIRLGPASAPTLKDHIEMALTALGVPVPQTIDRSVVPYRSMR
jgi:Protein of unknown function (DUF2971)